ncbi:putative DUF202 domain-containing protein [Seiridium cardinale]
MQRAELSDEEGATTSCCATLSCAQLRKPVEADGDMNSGWRTDNVFWTWPFFGPLVFENTTSDARDHCANERKTINKYSRKTAIVQSGWRTQSIMSLIALAIVATCVVLLIVNKLQVE